MVAGAPVEGEEAAGPRAAASQPRRRKAVDSPAVAGAHSGEAAAEGSPGQWSSAGWGSASRRTREQAGASGGRRPSHGGEERPAAATAAGAARAQRTPASPR